MTTTTVYTEADGLQEQLDANATRAPQVLLIAPAAEKVSAPSQVLEVDGFMCTTFEEPALGLAFAPAATRPRGGRHRTTPARDADVDRGLAAATHPRAPLADPRARRLLLRQPSPQRDPHGRERVHRSSVRRGRSGAADPPAPALSETPVLAALEERPAFHVDVHAIHHELARLRARGHAGDPVRHDLDDDINAVRSWRRRASSK